MKIYFVRHGDPNYRHDCLTELGHKQAQAAAKRLKEIVSAENEENEGSELIDTLF